MGRNKKYATDEDRKKARREQRMNYYWRYRDDIKASQNARNAERRASRDSRTAKDIIIAVKHLIPTPSSLEEMAREAADKLDAMTHASSTAFALEAARRALFLPVDHARSEMAEIMRRLVALHEPATLAKNAMFTHHGRRYQEWSVIERIEASFCTVEEYIDSIIRCLNDGTLQEYMDEHILAFCP
ncbi:hypothetical protein BDZ89DRAFT_1048957 [Hymenopellis radicata]|nr:hypothetical protein BDZ89DRAFT_1146737 [Hymenopellis radicata]KAF9005808.1 hypothetical protein BDZ89DRAFT_1048957 [Hymenopellis radicata]